MPGLANRKLIAATVRLVLLAMVCCAIVGCGSNKRKKDDVGKPVKLESIERRVALKAQWSRDLGDGQGKDDHRLTLGVSAKGVCAASLEGRVACYAHNGKKQWSRKTGETISAGVGVSDTQAFVVDANGRLYVYRRDNGELLWKVELRRQVLAAPQGTDEVIVVQSTDGRVLGLSPAAGDKLWEYRTDEPRLTSFGTATPVIDRGVVYTAFASGKLVALDTSNAAVIFDPMVAIASGTADIERIVDVDAAPKLTADSIYAASFNGNLFAFDRRSGRARWRVETSSYRELAEGRDKIYLVDEKSQVLAYSTASGEERWLQSALRNRRLSAPAVFDGYLLVADYKGYLHVLSQVNGEIVGRRRVAREGVRVPMRPYGDNLYIYADNGKLMAYRLAVKQD